MTISTRPNAIRTMFLKYYGKTVRTQGYGPTFNGRPMPDPCALSGP